MNNTKCFDFHLWNGKHYSSCREIEDAFREHGIRSKKISSIHPIGAADEFCPGEGFHLLRRELHIQCSPHWNQTAYDYYGCKYPQLGRTMLPCRVTLEEPTVIVFDDGSTMELHPCKEKGLKLSFDQIYADTHDGMNYSNFDARLLFGCIEGESIMGLRLWRDTQESQEDSFYNDATRTYQLWLTGNVGIAFKEEFGNRYELQLINQRCFVGHYRNPVYRIAFGEFMRASKGTKQILISAGGLSFGFALAPTAWDPKRPWEDGYEKAHLAEMVTTDEGDAYSFILYFLNKHLSQDFPQTEWGTWGSIEGEEDAVRYNRIVSYDLLREIIADIRATAALLKSDYDAPQLDAVKQMFSPYCIDREYIYTEPAPEKEQVLRENAEVIAQFYERFCFCAENMMQYNPQYGFVVVLGR